jgi:hypothetical protein
VSGVGATAMSHFPLKTGMFDRAVSVLWRGGEVDTIFGFEKEDDALQWIAGLVVG